VPKGVIRYLILSLFRISIEYYMRAVRILYTFKIHDWPLRAKSRHTPFDFKPILYLEFTS
jgi:hypothetical protein